MTAQIFKTHTQICKAHKPHEWQVLFTTWLDTLFDGMDASIFAMALFPTLSEILGTKSHSEVGVAASFILASFMIGWAVGSALFGILADRIGRVNTMIFTILLCAVRYVPDYAQPLTASRNS